MIEKILIRKQPSTEEIQIYVPSMSAPKGYVKLWDGNKDYLDVSIDSYKATTDVDEATKAKAVRNYVKVTGKKEPKVGERFPRNYQEGPMEAGVDFILKRRDNGLYVIEDAKGVLLGGFGSQDAAEAAMVRLLQGKSI